MKPGLLFRLRNALRQLVPIPGSFDAESLPPADRSRFYAYYDAARVRLDGATDLRESSKTIPALVLYGDGFSMLARAHAAAAGTDLENADVAAPLSNFVEYVGSRYEHGGHVLRDNLLPWGAQPSSIDALPPEELRARVAALSLVTPEVVALMTPESAGRRDARALAVKVAVVLALLASLVAVVFELTRPKNIALHKLATSATTAFDTKPSAAVNGKIFEQYGFHSDTEASPWLRVDLGRTYAIDRIRVHGRHDCCFDQSIPMAIELSFDGEKFTELARRDDPFDQLDPWQIDTDQPTLARYVRARTLKKGLLVLTELEVYGTPSR